MSNNSNSTINTKSTYDTIKNNTSTTIKYVKNKYFNYKKFLFVLLISVIIFLFMNYIFKEDGLNFLSDYKLFKILFVSFLSLFVLGVLYFTYQLSEDDEAKRNGVIPDGYNPDNNIVVFPLIKFTTYFLLGFLCIILVLYGLAKGFEKYPDSVSVVSGTLLILIFAVAIYAMYVLFIKTNKKRKSVPIQPGSIRLIKNLSLYSLYCLYSDIKNFIINELNKAPKEVWYILLIEFILIFMYIFSFYYKKFLLFILCHDAMKFLKDPVYLDNQTVVVSAEDLYGSNPENEEYIYNYSISYWFYLNPTANDDEYYNILNYNKKPIVEYNQHKIKLRVKMKEGREKENIVYLDNNIETQKWNHMVINYQSNTLDIFINNELVSTSSYKNMPIMSYDNIVVGENNGIEGGICNLMYFKRDIPKSTIDLLYYLCKNENPPII